MIKNQNHWKSDIVNKGWKVASYENRYPHWLHMVSYEALSLKVFSLGASKLLSSSIYLWFCILICFKSEGKLQLFRQNL